eukprot:scaffold12113_cov73-Cylindrotheca_fusiformis.AAC.1
MELFHWKLILGKYPKLVHELLPILCSLLDFKEALSGCLGKLGSRDRQIAEETIGSILNEKGVFNDGVLLGLVLRDVAFLRLF